MRQTTWFHTITRPVGPLVGTILVTVNVLVCGIIATINPTWQPALVIVAVAPAVVWYTFMAWVHQRERAGTRPEVEPPE